MNPFSRAPTFTLYIFAILGSIALSLWLNSTALINNDGILYLNVAKSFIEGGLHAATDVYSWPFYSILIALTQQLTHLSLESAALLLNIVLCTLVVTGFITLVKLLGGNFGVQVCAAIIILLFTGLNDYRASIVRDFGHWAFMLYALYFLILYAQKRKLGFAIAWNVCILIAFLFRTEAIFLMIFAPFVLLLPTQSPPFHKRLMHMIDAYTVTLCLIFIVIIAYFLNFHVFITEFLSANVWFKTALHFDFTGAIAKKLALFRPILPDYVNDQQLIYFVFGGLVFYFLLRFFFLLSPLYSILAGYAFYKKSIPAGIARQTVMTFIFIYIVVLFGFLALNLFLSERYLMPVALLVGLWAPFGLYAIYKSWEVRKTWIFPVIVAWLVYMLGDNLISIRPSELYLKEAGTWLSLHIPESTKNYSNNRQISYYGKHFRFFNQDYVPSFDYLALVSKDTDPKLRAYIAAHHLVLIKTFVNENGDTVEVYENSNQSQ